MSILHGRSAWTVGVAVGAFVSALVVAPSAARGDQGRYAVRNLVSDVEGNAEHLDPNLVNAWGLTALPSTPWWVSDNGTSVATLYDANGVAQPQPTPLIVALPGAGAPAAPTGAAANTTTSFVITLDGTTAPARFLFASEDGTISAWTRPPPPAPLPTHAVVVVDHSAANAVYKGLTLADTAAGPRLYATNFRDAVVEVFDGTFAQVSSPGAFVDPGIPPGFAPFGIQVVGGTVYVTYAKQDEARHDDVAGHHLGVVNAFGLDGTFLRRVASGGKLDSPWGLAVAPADFGAASGRLIVGNFGDGRIISYPLDGGGEDVGGKYLQGPKGLLRIDGLWALRFGNGAVAGPMNVLFFTAGPAHESHGLFGRVEVAADGG